MPDGWKIQKSFHIPEQEVLHPLFDSTLMFKYMYALSAISYTSSARQDTSLRLSGQAELPVMGVALGGVVLWSLHVEHDGQL